MPMEILIPIDGMTHDEVMASLEQEKAKKDARNQKNGTEINF